MSFKYSIYIFLNITGFKSTLLNVKFKKKNPHTFNGLLSDYFHINVCLMLSLNEVKLRHTQKLEGKNYGSESILSTLFSTPSEHALTDWFQQMHCQFLRKIMGVRATGENLWHQGTSGRNKHLIYLKVKLHVLH